VKTVAALLFYSRTWRIGAYCLWVCGVNVWARRSNETLAVKTTGLLHSVVNFFDHDNLPLGEEIVRSWFNIVTSFQYLILQ
jgi:hypothetical protein